MKKLLGFIVKLIFSLAVAIVIYLCSSIDIIATVLLFLVGKILIDFLGNRRIMNNKIKYKYKLTDFNEEYYDLYWETNMSRVNAFFNFFVFGLAICSYVDDLVKLSFEQGLAVDTFVIFVATVICALLIGSSKKENMLMELFDRRKQNWSGDYTKEEMNILKRIADL